MLAAEFEEARARTRIETERVHGTSNYHWPSDRPEHLDRESVSQAARLALAFVRALDRDAFH